MTGKQANTEKGSGAAMIASFTMLVLSLVVMTGAFVINLEQAGLSHSYARNAAQLQVLSQQIAVHASTAVSGEEEAFSLLAESVSSFDRIVNDLNGAELSLLPLANTEIPAGQIAGVAATWSETRAEAENILATQASILSLHSQTTTLNETMPQLQIEYDEVVSILLDSNAPADQIALAQRQPWLAERIMGNVSRVLEGGDEAVMAADSFGRDTKLFGRGLSGMLQGNPAMGISRITNDQATGRLIEIAELFVFIDRTVDEILEMSPELFQARQGADLISADAQQLLQQTSVLADTLSNANQIALELTIIIASGLSLLFLLLSAITVRRRLQIKAQEPDRQIDVNDTESAPDPQVISQLFDEMHDSDAKTTETASQPPDDTPDLGDNRRTINTLINDDLTTTSGPSAQQLNDLAETIDQVADRVDVAVQETQTTARLLAEASDHQAQEIGASVKSVNLLAQAIEHIASQAAECAKAAEHSGQMVANSGLAVRSSNDGAGSIQAQLQDATAWLKRLGQSSREITELVALINDIADQTNMLSLNATIQASMAGDAGRGFASSAEEIQRLTERVATATRQVGTLVSKIESDAGEAANAMEQSASEFDLARGKLMPGDASDPLREIEQTCNQLTTLIRDIAEAAREQAQSAATVASHMASVGNIATQTSSGTRATAQSIGELAGMTTEMRRCVMSLRLPATGACHE